MLPNGLTLLVEETHAAPVVAIQVWVRVGSADERADEAGLAHLHEHMLFKGTARRGPGEIARTIEACGGEINAWTSFDQTVYHLVLASQFFAEGMDVLADAVTSAAFDPGELQREIEVVCEEIKRSMDSPTRKRSRELFASAFAGHPYGKPVIGTEESVRSFRREGILRFYRRWYKPENIVVIVVGDVREAEAVRLAQKLFAWPPGPFEAAPARPAEPHREVPLARLRKEPLKEGYLSIAWPSPPLVHEDVAALDALAIVLGHGEASRLHRAMKRDRLLCTEVQASCYTPVDPGLTIVGLTLQPANAREAVREALAQTYRLRSEEVTAEELSVACRLLEGDAVYQRETVQSQARKLGFYQSSAGGVEVEQRAARRGRLEQGHQHAAGASGLQRNGDEGSGEPGAGDGGDGRFPRRELRPQQFRAARRVPLPASGGGIRRLRGGHLRTCLPSRGGPTRAHAADRRAQIARGQSGRRCVPALRGNALPQPPVPIRHAGHREQRGPPRAATARAIPGTAVSGGSSHALDRRRRGTGRSARPGPADPHRRAHSAQRRRALRRT